MVWEYQAPGTRAGPGLISWQQASNWVRTVSGPWLWPYRDWITPSRDRQKGEGGGERVHVAVKDERIERVQFM